MNTTHSAVGNGKTACGLDVEKVTIGNFPNCINCLREELKEIDPYSAGPWERGKGNCHTVYGPKINGHQQVIAICPTQTGDHDYDSRKVANNAKLIASALDLMAVKNAVTDMMHDLNIFYGKYRDPDNRLFANLKKAIAAVEATK